VRRTLEVDPPTSTGNNSDAEEGAPHRTTKLVVYILEEGSLDKVEREAAGNISREKLEKEVLERESFPIMTTTYLYKVAFNSSYNCLKTCH